MLARIHSAVMVGIDALACEVEIDVGRGGFDRSTIVGLPDKRVDEELMSPEYIQKKIYTPIRLSPLFTNT
jgi:hypothetical protein